jgi:hypothetical protein
VNAVFNKRFLVVWVVLSSITLAYVWMDHSVDHDGIFSPSAVVTSSAIVMASIKVRIIFREFMEVRHAPVLLCRLTDLWVAIIAVSLLGSYFIGAWLSR